MSSAPATNVNIHLTRINGQVPWGFRMAGGADFRSPLLIQRVTPGTVSANSGVVPGDIIVQINGVHTGLMTHKEAQHAILSTGNNLALGLSRDLAHLTMAPPTHDHHYRPSVKYTPNPHAAPASIGHGDAYVAPGYAYQSRDSSLQVPGFAPEERDLPTSKTLNSTTITTSRGSRMIYSGSVLNPPQQQTPSQPIRPAYHQQPQQQQQHKPQTQRQAPASPAIQPVQHVAAPFSPPQQSVSAGYQGQQQHVPAAASPPAAAVKQAAPKPWVPADSNSNKVSDLPCGDSTAHKGVSTYYSSAPLDPSKIPVCSGCHINIRGPFIVALNKCWCPTHFTCAKCKCELINMGFVELNGKIYCEKDYEANFAPRCAKCSSAIMGDTVNALKKTWHKHCFLCTECGQSISAGAFHVEDGKPYCLQDWQRLFQTKCAGCDFPVEPGDRWIEALDVNWHSECFACNVCNVPLEGKPFFARDGRPFCKGHAGAAAAR